MGALGCGIQTGAGAVINSLPVSPGSSFTSFGAGAVGLSAVMAARVAGATTIVAVDVVGSRLELALELGATHVVNSRDTDPIEAIREITGGGTSSALERDRPPGGAGARHRGARPARSDGCRRCPATRHRSPVRRQQPLAGGRTIRGIVEGDSVPQQFIPQLVALHQQGRFPFDKLVTHYPLAEINQAARDSTAGRTLKPILRVSE